MRRLALLPLVALVLAGCDSDSSADADTYLRLGGQVHAAESRWSPSHNGAESQTSVEVLAAPGTLGLTLPDDVTPGTYVVGNRAARSLGAALYLTDGVTVYTASSGRVVIERQRGNRLVGSFTLVLGKGDGTGIEIPVEARGRFEAPYVPPVGPIEG